LGAFPYDFARSILQYGRELDNLSIFGKRTFRDSIGVSVMQENLIVEPLVMIVDACAAKEQTVELPVRISPVSHLLTTSAFIRSYSQVNLSSVKQAAIIG
jgi:hypothetical protein